MAVVMDYGKLSDRGLDKRCAEFAEPEPGSIPEWFDVTNDLTGERPRSPKRMYYAVCIYEHGDAPEWVPLAFSADLNAARELEDEIERRGLWFEWAGALLQVLRPGATREQLNFLTLERVAWITAHATARQRAEAFCVVMSRAMEAAAPEKADA